MLSRHFRSLPGRSVAPRAATSNGGVMSGSVGQAGTVVAVPFREASPAERTLEAAAACARRLWGPRLVSVYAIGSLAHGGFSQYVSDVDVALILNDPLEACDPIKIAALPDDLRESGSALAGRVSLFWGSVATLN